MRWRMLAVAVFLICSAVASRAGGPAFVAGSGYNAGVEGQALIWANGSVQYFTDQGNLSPILTGAQADALVASAFSTWTSISGVALTASQGGHLAEDVNGSNIVVDGSGVDHRPGGHYAFRHRHSGWNCLRLRRNGHRCDAGRGRWGLGRLLHQRRLWRTRQLFHGWEHRARAWW